MDHSAIITGVCALISAVLAYITKVSAAKHRRNIQATETQQEQLLQFYKDLTQECQSLRKSNTDLMLRVSELQSEVHKLREQLEYYEDNHLAVEARDMLSNIFNYGFKSPAWIHDVGNNRWYVNDPYCRQFSVDRPSFWHPVNIFGLYKPDDVRDYIRHDFQVLDCGVPIVFSESVRKRVMDPECEESIVAEFKKTPIVIGDRQYIFGCMLSKHDPE